MTFGNKIEPELITVTMNKLRSVERGTHALSSIPDADQATTSAARCVLLAGSARGGTSWALKTLDAHPAICGCHEPFYQLTKDESLRGLVDRLKDGQGTEQDARLLISMTTKGRVETHKPPFFPKHFLKAPAMLRTGAWMSARAFNSLRPIFEYLETGNLTDDHRLVIKNRPFPHLDRVLKSINSDVLILLRHPCGVVNSWLRGIRMGVMDGSSADPATTWKRYSQYLEPIGLTEQQLFNMSETGVLAVNWLVDTLIFRQYESSNLRTRTVVYEDLVSNPIDEWTRVFEWMGLPFDPAVKSFLTDSSKPRFDIRNLMGKKYAYFSVQRREKSPKESWRTDMTSYDIAEVMNIVTPHFQVDHYWPTTTPSRPVVLKTLEPTLAIIP